MNSASEPHDLLLILWEQVLYKKPECLLKMLQSSIQHITSKELKGKLTFLCWNKVYESLGEWSKTCRYCEGRAIANLAKLE